MAWGCSLHGTGCSLATRVAASVARGCRRHGEAQRLQRGAQGDGSHLGLAAREGADDARLAAGQRGHAAAQLRLQLGEAGGTERLRGDHPDGPVVEPRVPLSEDAHVREEGAWHLHEDGGRAGGRAGGLAGGRVGGRVSERVSERVGCKARGWVAERAGGWRSARVGGGARGWVAERAGAGFAPPWRRSRARRGRAAGRRGRALPRRRR